MKKYTGWITTVPLIVSLVAGSVLPTTQITANAEVTKNKVRTDVKTGTDGTASWTIDSAGVLTIHSGTFSDSSSNHSSWNDYKNDITKIVIEPGVKATGSMTGLFMNYQNLKTIEGLSNLDTSSVTSMSSVFGNLPSFQDTTLDLSKWDTSNVTDMSKFVYGMPATLTTIKNDDWNTSKVTTFSNAFGQNKGLMTLDTSKINTGNATDLSGMFTEDNAFTPTDGISDWDVSKVTTVSQMFSNDKSIKDLDLAKWKTTNLTETSMMFYGAKFNSLNLAGWDTSKLVASQIMLGSLSSATGQGLLDLSGWSLPVEGSGMTLMNANPAELKVNAKTRLDKLGFSKIKVRAWEAEAGGTKYDPKGRKKITATDLLTMYSGTDTDAPGETYTTYVEPVSQLSVSTRDTTIVMGPTAKWEPKDNFVSATDFDGNPVNFDKITVTGEPDLSQANTYPITYLLDDGNGNDAVAYGTVSVVETQASIDAHSSTIDQGTTWNANDNFTKATDAFGNSISLKDVKVTGTVDTSKAGDYNITYEYKDVSGNVFKKTVKVEVKAKSSSTPTDPTQPAEPNQPNKGKPFKVYTKLATNEYSGTVFTSKNKIKHYVQKNRVYAPTFTVKKVVKNKYGKLRYQLSNGHYITANQDHTGHLYWQNADYTKLYVINPKGTFEHKSTNFAKKTRSKWHRQGEKLQVKRIIRYGLTTRYQLANGNYISGNKEWTSPTKWSWPHKVQAKGAINLYKDANLTKKVKHYKAKQHKIFKVKGFDYSHSFENRGYTKRYKVDGGYITGNSKLVKKVE